MRQLLLFVTTVILFACNGPSENKKGSASGVTLTESNLYSEDTVLMVANAGAARDKEADKLFLQAIDVFRNKKDPSQAVALFKKSILAQPQARAYYEMGNALGDQGKLQEGLQAYDIADILDYKPLNKLLYNKACLYARSGELAKAKQYLISAIEFGYGNLKNLQKDKDLDKLREDAPYNFNDLIMTAMSGSSDPDKLQWAVFSHEFTQVKFPLLLDMKYADHMTEDKIISYDNERYVPEMRDYSFSRDVGGEYYRVGLVRANDSNRTLIYGVVDEMGGNILPVYYIASFNNKGTLIDKLLIGGQKILKDPYKVATITANYDIEISNFELTYSKDPNEEGYEDNPIRSQKPLGKDHYAIREDGHFVKKDVVLGMR
ncbi:tetratricopeptide repeat protein [Chitinophaga sancti]|uniref:tetratricopeptide repeat protein n=1 Tax=Chitinophaga sancti TaxID=1004 RepID=UPI003F7A6594